MRTNHLRTISHWFTWEDMDFPNPAVEERIRQKVAAAAAAKVELAVVFGYHFRWDYVFNFDLIHKLSAFTVNEYHKYGIKVIDHHSAVLTYRPRNWEDRVENFNRNHHHVPMTPDPAFIDCLSYAGKKLNDFRQRRVDDNTPIYIARYHSECFCVNNPDFRFAYQSYVQRLFSDTNIDGLMCDDVCHYAHWASCGCEHCRRKFNLATGKILPDTSDFSFWGNYDNPDFRMWIKQHAEDGRDFLAMVRNAIPAGKLLTSCCSSSTGKSNDNSGLDMAVWHSSLNTVMLEMCGNISGGKNSIEVRIPDMLLNGGIAEKYDMPCLGLGYAFFPAEGFQTWSLNKFFNSDSWISTHKTRCGLTFEEQCQLPDEPEIVHEAYNFDARYPELSELTDTAQVAVYFSSASRNYNGSFSADYADGFKEIIRALYRSNVAVNVTSEVPENADKIKYLILSNCDSLSDKELAAFASYQQSGGTLIVTGLMGSCDEFGTARASGSPLKKYGIDPQKPQVDRTLPPEVRKEFFQITFWEIPGTVPPVIEFTGKENLPEPDKYGFYKLAEKLLWTPVLGNAPGQAENIAEMLKNMIQTDLQITLPEDLRYRVYTDKNGNSVVHFMPITITANLHPTVKLHKTGNPIVESLNYGELTGTVEIAGNIKGAKLYAADLSEVKAIPVTAGKAVVELQGLKRFFSVIVEK